MKRIIAIMLVLAMMFTFVGCNYKSEFKDYAENKIYVEMVVKNYGLMTIELDPAVAPITVHNFATLVSEGFYDGLTFHRIISGFMIQGGDPDGNGTGGSEKNIKGEFSANGVENNLSHERGVISMARSTAYDSASSQFFICHAAAPHLDGGYAAFGKVVEGLEVVDAIAAVTTDSNDAPTSAVVIDYAKIVHGENLIAGIDTSEETRPDWGRGDYINVEMSVKDFGVIKLKLDHTQAPITVENFVSLVEEGFYDGLTFHRIIKDFMIQGGDPKGNGTGGSDENIKGEFAYNYVDNSISHKRGVISMARGGNDFNSASSQFFICHKDSTYLDGQYAAFGEVTEGIEVVDAIAEVKTNSNDYPEEKVVIEYIKVIEEK